MSFEQEKYVVLHAKQSTIENKRTLDNLVAKIETGKPFK